MKPATVACIAGLTSAAAAANAQFTLQSPPEISWRADGEMPCGGEGDVLVIEYSGRFGSRPEPGTQPRRRTRLTGINLYEFDQLPLGVADLIGEYNDSFKFFRYPGGGRWRGAKAIGVRCAVTGLEGCALRGIIVDPDPDAAAFVYADLSPRGMDGFGNRGVPFAGRTLTDLIPYRCTGSAGVYAEAPIVMPRDDDPTLADVAINIAVGDKNAPFASARIPLDTGRPGLTVVDASSPIVPDSAIVSDEGVPTLIVEIPGGCERQVPITLTLLRDSDFDPTDRSFGFEIAEDAFELLDETGSPIPMDPISMSFEFVTPSEEPATIDMSMIEFNTQGLIDPEILLVTAPPGTVEMDGDGLLLAPFAQVEVLLPNRLGQIGDRLFAAGSGIIQTDGSFEFFVYGDDEDPLPLPESALLRVSVLDGFGFGASSVVIPLGQTCLADVTTTGATIPGFDGYAEPDGVVNLDDLGYFLNFWLEGCR